MFRALIALSLTTVCTATASAQLLVSSRFTDEVLAYDATTGAFQGVFAAGGGLDNPVGLTFGPDGNLYVASGDSNQVLRYDGVTGDFIDVVVNGPAAPRQVNFGPDGFLYVASGANDRVLAYDPSNGTLVRIAAIGNGLNGPTSFTFGPDGNLYVVSVLTNRILVYDGADGTFLGIFVQQFRPHDLAFGPDGHLYVTNAFGSTIHRYDGHTGASLGLFTTDAALTNALGLVWDDAGNLLVANQGRDEVRRYDGATGALIDSLVPMQSGGLNGPLFLTFAPTRGGPQLAPPTSLLGGSTATIVATGLQPGASFRSSPEDGRAARGYVAARNWPWGSRHPTPGRSGTPTRPGAWSSGEPFQAPLPVPNSGWKSSIARVVPRAERSASGWTDPAQAPSRARARESRPQTSPRREKTSHHLGRRGEQDPTGPARA